MSNRKLRSFPKAAAIVHAVHDAIVCAMTKNT